MLKRLFVKDFVLIDECCLEFESGFSAFTGETGAGKSLLIDAMCLLQGERASSSFVKRDATKAIVEGVFDISNNKKALEKMVLANLPMEDNSVCLRREIYKDGKSIVTVNKKNATLQLLKDIIQHEIDIHSQHDNQYLLNKSNHIQLVNQVVVNQSLIKEVQMNYDVYHKIKTEFELALNTTYNENDLEFIQAEIQEIEDANLSSEKEADLEARQRDINLFEKSFKKLNSAYHQLNQDNGINEQLYSVINELEDLDSEEIQYLAQSLNEQYNEIVDIGDQIKNLVNSMDISEDEINEVQQEIYEIQRLKRKYGPTIKAILEHRVRAIQQVEMILHRQDYIDKMQKDLNEAKEKFLKCAGELSLERKSAALELQKEIERHCHDLMLPNVCFLVDFQEIEDGNKNGIDDVEFYISMNPGEMPKPLSRVASGGELSRLMLGLKTIFTKLQGIQTVIFDEIDSGVSGPVASSIGLKMATLASDVQVFSVTHLAQVASCATKHYLVKKEVVEETTRTQVVELNEQERISQMALIASGSVSDASIKAARELYEYSLQQINSLK